jgi:hypothetical protein
VTSGGREPRKLWTCSATLRLAYKFKANNIHDETVPDPVTDDSFRSFVGNADFVKSVHEMQK